MDEDKKAVPLSRAIVLVGIFFVVMTFAVVITVNYIVQKKLIYNRYEHEMGEVLRYIESNIDSDDLYESFTAGKKTAEYIELQRFLDNFIDNYSVHYLYALQPVKDEEGNYYVISIISASTMWEKENEPENLLDMGYVEEYNPELVRKLMEVMAGDDIQYLVDNTEWGSDYTAAVPLVNSEGEHYGVLCVDQDITDIQRAILQGIATNTISMMALAFIFIVMMIRWLDGFVIRPITSISEVISQADLVEDVDRFPVIAALEKMECRGKEMISLRDTLVLFMLENHFYSTNLKYAREEMVGMDHDMHTDVLTGLGNARLFEEESAKINKQLHEGVCNFSIIVVDINNLKKINDTYGHEKGDIFIQGCSEIMKECCGDAVVCRTGGDEFVAVFMGYNASKKAAFSEIQLNSAYYDATHGQGQPWEKYSASVGKASWEEDDKEFSEVLKRADRRMYEAKLKHKNKYGSYR